jgi:NSS family neurotransmitter:Na+ symporter
LGIPSSLGFGVWDFISLAGMSILDMFDFFTNSVMMPIVAFLTCIVVAWVLKLKPISQEIELSGKFKRKALFEVMIKYVAPVFIVLILVSSVLDAFGIFKI